MALAKYNTSISPCCIKKCQLKAYNNLKINPALKPVLKLVMLAPSRENNRVNKGLK
jgi:hypothetical protein